MSRRSHVTRPEHLRRPTRPVDQPATCSGRVRVRVRVRARARARWTVLGVVLAAASGLAVGPAGAVPGVAQPSGTTIRTVVLTYNDEQAPSFQSEIAQGAAIWNAAVSNVTLTETDGVADFTYIEGGFGDGDNTDTDGHGHGQVYIPVSLDGSPGALRFIDHQTGHVLGLPDHYSGPCSELMSGPGPGTGCTNPYPDAAESANVDWLWAAVTPSRPAPQR